MTDFRILVETGFHHVDQVGRQLLTSGDLPTLASQSAGTIGISHRARPTKPNSMLSWVLNEKNLLLLEKKWKKQNENVSWEVNFVALQIKIWHWLVVMHSMHDNSLRAPKRVSWKFQQICPRFQVHQNAYSNVLNSLSGTKRIPRVEWIHCSIHTVDY